MTETLNIAVQELNADLDTPVTAYLKVAQGERVSFLLESVEAGEKLGRYSFIGVGEQGQFVYSGGQVQSSGIFGDYSGTEADPLARLYHVTRRRLSVPEGLPAFVGGAVGYAAYDIIRAYEKLPGGNPDELNVEAVLMRGDQQSRVPLRHQQGSVYSAEVPLTDSGLYSLGVRMIPQIDGLSHLLETGLIKWA